MTQPAVASRVPKSMALYKRALELIPGGTQLISRRPNRVAYGVSPVYAQSAKGARFIDVDGFEYIDWISGIASIILGYADPVVDEAVRKQIEKGTVYSVNHELEVELAEELCREIPCAEMVRYAKCGGEACAIAVRIARGTTGRDKILFCGYHGWHDWYLAANLAEEASLNSHLFPGIEATGVPQGLAGTALPFAFGDLNSLGELLDQHKGEVAAVIMEPLRSEIPPEGYLAGVAKLAREHGAIFIFDEVSAGLRFSTGGAQKYLGVTPDMAVFAKSISNGYPMAAVVGSREVMEPAVADVYLQHLLERHDRPASRTDHHAGSSQTQCSGPAVEVRRRAEATDRRRGPRSGTRRPLHRDRCPSPSAHRRDRPTTESGGQLPWDAVARQLRLTGPTLTISSACASGTLAIGASSRRDSTRWIDVAIAGGADALCVLTYSGFNALRSLDPEPCRPFRADRVGLSLGEGAGVLVLETARSAQSRERNRSPSCSGWGASCDAHHMTAPHPEGDGAARAIAAALSDAELQPDEIGFVNAHGTGTPLNDISECRALHRVSASRASGIPVTANKASVGHRARLLRGGRGLLQRCLLSYNARSSRRRGW